jgi:mannose-6-phosphate isomerase
MTENIFKPKPYLLKNKIQNYAWGQRNSEAFIPKLLGFTPEKDKPYAELWIGAHPKAPSMVKNTSLFDLIAQHPNQILGQKAAKKFNNQLPFLMKVLTAGEALSIQAHPNKSQAHQLHDRDPEHYPDDNHKPEIAIALDNLTALVGFKSLTKIKETLREYFPIAAFVRHKINSMQLNNKSALKEFYAALMKRAEQEPEALEATLVQMDDLIVDKQQRNEADDLYLELRQKYGTDVGLFSLYLFNLLHLNRGEAVFLKAGIPHAYLKGNIIECMANSDNVVRAGLTPKFKDVSTLVDILTYETGLPQIIRNDSTDKEIQYRVPIPEFSIICRNFNDCSVCQIKNSRLEIFLLTKGKITIQSGDFSEDYQRGDTILIPAALKNYTLEIKEPATLYSAIIPEN